ncbi:MAG: hypothetical protein WC789_03180 [Lentisphaeria bacterium]|jgi:hypothetical protein
MPDFDFLSIDQNSNVLWDTLPKLAALARQGWRGRHCVEDIDVAFTRQGAAAGAPAALELAPERYYRTGNSDWGAALFHTAFLGRNPLNPRELEPQLGMSVAALARKLELSLDELYARYAGSDNWQLIGSSYLGGGDRHRVIGDLGTAECAPFLRELLERARRDCEQAFPEPAAQARLRQWFEAEAAALEAMLAEFAAAPLVRLYQGWLRRHLPPAVGLALTSDFFTLDRTEPRERLLGRCILDYADWAAAYNEAVAGTACGLKPLDAAAGELPFFAVWRDEAGRLYRTGLRLEQGRLVAGERTWAVGADGMPPLDAMRQAGLVCLAGKALLLVLQARLQPGGGALALPHLGSLYMPAARRLEANLRAAGLLEWPLFPLLRVRFRFFDRWLGCATRIRLPDWLHGGGFSAAELAAGEFARELPDVLDRAERELAALRSPQGREACLGRLRPAESATLAELEARRRELAREPATRAAAGRVWDEVKALERQRLQALFEHAWQLRHTLNLRYWDSRGALLPFSIALGGEAFYESVLAQAEIAEE